MSILDITSLSTTRCLGVFSVAAAEGLVTLRGVVPTFTMLAEIERAVSSIPGITRIDNKLQVV